MALHRTFSVVLFAGLVPASTIPFAPRANIASVVEDVDGGSGERHVRGEDELPPLIAVAKDGDVEAVRRLLANGVDPNQRGPSGTALIYAVARSSLEIVEVLLARGADPSADSPSGTALLQAAFSGNAPIARALLAHGASPNQPSPELDGRTPLIQAMERGHLPVVKLLLQSHANPNATTPLGTALAIAVDSADLPTLKLLLDHGAAFRNADPAGVTPLHVAAERGALEIGRVLIERGAPLDARTAKDCTALDLARRNHHDDFAAMLIAAGAKEPVAPPVVADDIRSMNSPDVNWDGPLFVMDDRHHAMLDTDCFELPDDASIGLKAVGVAPGARFTVMTVDGLRLASARGLSCSTPSDCFASKILVLLEAVGPSPAAAPLTSVPSPPKRERVYLHDGAIAAALEVTVPKNARFRELDGVENGAAPCAPRPVVAAPEDAECRTYRLHSEPDLLLQMWTFDESTPVGYPNYRAYLRTIRGTIAAPWRELQLGAIPPRMWLLSLYGESFVRVLMRSTSGGVGPKAYVRMMRISSTGDLELGRMYRAGGDACD